MGFKFDAGDVLKNMADQEIKLKAALGVYSDSVAKKLEGSAKTNRPWTDRTGDARKTLKGSWKWTGAGTRVELKHGVSYGVYLELCQEGKFAVLEPTINKESPGVMKGLENLLGK